MSRECARLVGLLFAAVPLAVAPITCRLAVAAAAAQVRPSLPGRPADSRHLLTWPKDAGSRVNSHPRSLVVATASTAHALVMNLHDRSASVIWHSAFKANGSVLFGTSCGTNDSGLTNVSTVDSGNGYVHAVALSGLAPATTYYYATVSGTTDDNGGVCYQFTTLPASELPPPAVASGRVMTGPTCSSPVTSGIVSVTDSQGGVASLPNETDIGSPTSAAPGGYAVPFSPTAAADSSGYRQATPGDAVTITIDTGVARASTKATWSGASTVLSMPTLCLPVPGAPRLQTAVGGVRQISVSWQPPTYAGGSAISGYRVTVANGSGGVIYAAAATATSATVTGLKNGATYSVFVRALNTTGAGNHSATMQATTFSVPTAPQTLQGSASDSQVNLSWLPPASNGGTALTSYTVRVKVGGVTQATYSGLNPATICSSGTCRYTVSGLTNGTNYAFFVNAVNAVGAGPSASVSSKPHAGP